MPDETIRFSETVDKQGRVTIPQNIRKLLGIDGREALVEFEVRFQDFVDEESHTDNVDDSDDHTDFVGSVRDSDDSQ